MDGYEFIGWQAISDALKNEPLTIWLAEHSVFIGLVMIVGPFIAKLTPTKKDDEVWAALKERWEKFTKKEPEKK